ncbi:MFS transporter [Actinomadura sp. 1N219]|uniref:MFS transporter n=1 Tax=Actinomadura sp. 1N219 TaxID=3375152 RepID=UPI0037AD510F
MSVTTPQEPRRSERAGARPADPVERHPVSRCAVVASSFGNFVEWFDYSVYGFFATVIAGAFFPSENETASLMASFAAFGLTFAARPLGAFVFGHFGDRFGRRTALAVSVLMMGFASLAIGLLPSFGAIGLWAPVLLVAARLTQGFSAGGEAGGSSSYLAESAPPGKRGLYTSWQQFTIVLGLLAGSGSGVLLSTVLSEDALQSWGWRLPFLLGGLMAVIGLYLRLNLDDTPAFRELADEGEVDGAPLLSIFRTHWRTLLKAVGFFVSTSVTNYTLFVYMPSYANTELGVPMSRALLSNSIALGLVVCLIPLVGILSDRLGRRPLLLFFNGSLALATYPLFLLVSAGTFPTLVAAQLVFAVLASFGFGAGTALYTEMFPTRVRYTGIGVSLGVSAAIFGGSAPFISTWLVSATGDQIAPAFYLIAAALISFVAVYLIAETYRSPLRKK